jgi:hypothetical protein
MKISHRFLIFVLLGWISAQTCIGQTPDQETERREAAAGFLYPQAFVLSVLRMECGKWLAGSSNDVDEVARAWWTRNRYDLDAATWITGEAIRRYRSTMPPDKALIAERQIMQSESMAGQSTLRSAFKRQLPTPDTCAGAVQQYKSPQLDVANLGSTKGFEQFSEFGATLKRARLDKSYRPIDDTYRTFETQVGVSKYPLATLDAVEAAKERHDPSAILQGYMSLVERGDSTAPISVGLFYLNGQYIPHDYQRAIAWFYNAWAMGEADGINALGVMARDGLGMPKDNHLAIAAFAVAKKMATNGNASTLQRATSNYTRLLPTIPEQELLEVGRMRWESLDEKFRSFAAASTDIRLHNSPAMSQGHLADSGLFAVQEGR